MIDVTLPATWSSKRLKYLATYNDEVLPESTDEEAEIDYVEISGVSLSRGVEQVERISFGQAPSRARRKVRSGDILISTVRTYLRAIAKVDEASPDLIASTGFCVVRPDREEVDSGYLGWAAKSEPFVSEVVSRSVGVSYPAINASELVTIEVPLPPLETQRRIAQFLDEKTARIDGLIEKKRALLDRLAEKRQALITRAVTKGLNPEAPMKPSGIDWLGDIPSHWDVRGLTKCTTRVDYRGATPTKSAEGVFLVTARNIKNGQIDYEVSQEFIPEEEYAHVMRRGKPKIGEVLFTTEAPLGEVARVDNEGIALAQRIIKFSSSIEQLTNDYLAYWMYSSLFQRDVLSRATGSTALGIKASKIVELKCLLPPEVEQKEISDLLDADAEKRNDVIKEIGKSIALLEEYRSAVITAAVTGQIGELQ